MRTKKAIAKITLIALLSQKMLFLWYTHVYALEDFPIINIFTQSQIKEQGVISQEAFIWLISDEVIIDDVAKKTQIISENTKSLAHRDMLETRDVDADRLETYTSIRKKTHILLSNMQDFIQVEHITNIPLHVEKEKVENMLESYKKGFKNKSNNQKLQELTQLNIAYKDIQKAAKKIQSMWVLVTRNIQGEDITFIKYSDKNLLKTQMLLGSYIERSGGNIDDYRDLNTLLSKMYRYKYSAKRDVGNKKELLWDIQILYRRIQNV